MDLTGSKEDMSLRRPSYTNKHQVFEEACEMPHRQPHLASGLLITLMGDKVEPRREFIQNHALEVSELDV